MKRSLCILLTVLLFVSCLTAAGEETEAFTLTAGEYVAGESIPAGEYLVTCPPEVETALMYRYPIIYEKWYQYEQMFLMGAFVGEPSACELTLADGETLSVLCGAFILTPK